MTGDDQASTRLRVAILAGTLARGGAEKQLVYLVEALQTAGAQLRVLSLTRGEFFEPALRALGVEPVYVGRFGNPMLRTAAIAAALRDFRPHIVQAAHFYVNLYVGLVAPLLGAIGIGTARSDVVHEVEANRSWGRWLLRMPSALVVNSHAARRNAVALGIPSASIHVVPNAIDLAAFDELAAQGPAGGGGAGSSSMSESIVVGVGSLVPAKRFDRFLEAVALARARGAALRAVLAGDGPERGRLESLARELGLLPHGVCFAGQRSDIPALLRGASIHLLTSEHEGFPNVLLEAMAACLPIVTTPAGDAAVIVEDGVAGFVVPEGDVEAMAARITELAASSELRQRFGAAGRRRVETDFTCSVLPQRVTLVHRAIAERLGHRRSLAVLPG